jgi:hypothetical protein
VTFLVAQRRRARIAVRSGRRLGNVLDVDHAASAGSKRRNPSLVRADVCVGK